MVTLPDCFRHTWSYFLDLHSKRLHNGFNPIPLQYSEISSYFNLYKIDFTVSDVKLIALLDDITIQYSINKNNKEMNKNNNKHKNNKK